jgi:hypothetical protein
MADKNMTRTFSQAAKDAGVPIQIKTEDISSLGVVEWVSAEKATSTLPQTGEESEGYFVVINDHGTNYSAFVGGMALCRMLDTLQLPFMAQIVKSGRTWVFSD